MSLRGPLAHALCVLSLGLGWVLGQTTSVTPAPTPARSTPTPPAAPTPTDKQRLASLPESDRRWLEVFVAPIILPAEKKAYLELTEPYEHEAFREQFWKRRERDGQLPPLGPGYRYRYADLRELADSVYDDWPNDAASMVIRYGEPADLRSIEGCGKTFLDGLEIWTYNHSSALGFRTQRYLFYRRSLGEPRRLWVFGTPASEIFAPNSCRKNYPELINDCTVPPMDKCFGPVCDGACEVFKVWSETASRQGSVASGQLERSHLFEPEEVSLEGLDSVKQQSPNWSNPQAAKIGVEGPRGTVGSSAGLAAEREPHRELSRDEILERIGRLDPKYKRFLDAAAPLMTEHEVSEFLQLTPAEKDRFIGDFWRRRK
jgi:hypothetical protein